MKLINSFKNEISPRIRQILHALFVLNHVGILEAVKPQREVAQSWTGLMFLCLKYAALG